MQGAQGAHEKQEQWHPEATADTYGSQVLGAGVTGHDRIDHPVRHLRNLGDEDRSAKNGEGAPFGKYPAQ
ncbi:hypothetical protein GCM10009113_18210 [Marinobacter szutsaonensis]